MELKIMILSKRSQIKRERQTVRDRENTVSDYKEAGANTGGMMYMVK